MHNGFTVSLSHTEGLMRESEGAEYGWGNTMLHPSSQPRHLCSGKERERETGREGEREKEREGEKDGLREGGGEGGGCDRAREKRERGGGREGGRCDSAREREEIEGVQKRERERLRRRETALVTHQNWAVKHD